MIKIDLRDGMHVLNELMKKLSPKQIADASRMALNEAARKGKTEVKNAILSVYNIKPSRITDSNRKKGLSIKPATNRDLTAEIDAGHLPTQLADANIKFKGTAIAQGIKIKDGKVKKGNFSKRSKSSVSVEVKKGDRKTLGSAFVPGTATAGGTQMLTPLIFSRGKKGKPTFQFAKPRYPIDTLSSISVATAATNVNAKDKYEPTVRAYMQQRFVHHIQRMIKSI
jgi:hypothetical protein